ncbi:MAG TPA: class III extradiol dioxygenase subunit B-like domain-containing protein [Mycobacteriales bacterium]|nr:class III extradiol dioxygenase subunit B-like domain-containing protein [Mycobacteriales bacterium]
MLVAAAFCPHPPVILPEVAAGASADLDPLREACAEAIDRMVRARADRILVVGAGAATRWIGSRAAGGFAGFGVDVAVGWGGPGPGTPDLPLSLAVGAWLLARCDHDRPVSGLVVAGDAGTEECRRLGEEIPARTALLVMGDGSARRETEAPGYLDERAVPFDQEVVRMLGSADVDGLLGLDPGLAADLLVAGRAPWQVAASAADGPIRAEVLYDQAPYGVGYFVAAWESA